MRRNVLVGWRADLVCPATIVVPHAAFICRLAASRRLCVSPATRYAIRAPGGACISKHSTPFSVSVICRPPRGLSPILPLFIHSVIHPSVAVLTSPAQGFQVSALHLVPLNDRLSFGFQTMPSAIYHLCTYHLLSAISHQPFARSPLPPCPCPFTCSPLLPILAASRMLDLGLRQVHFWSLSLPPFSLYFFRGCPWSRRQSGRNLTVSSRVATSHLLPPSHLFRQPTTFGAAGTRHTRFASTRTTTRSRPLFSKHLARAKSTSDTHFPPSLLVVFITFVI